MRIAIRLAQGIDSVSAHLHAEWQKNFPSTNPGQTSRWKPAKDDADTPFESLDAMIAASGPSPLPEEFRPYFRPSADASGSGPVFEADILHLPYQFLPPNLKKLNSKAAEFVVTLLQSEPGRDVDYYADKAHEQWMEMSQWILQNPNATEAEKALFKPFAELPDSEKSKDRAIVRVAMDALGIAR